jgi:hypothetical protein
MKGQSNEKPSVSGMLARHWWLLLLPCCFSLYITAVSLLIEVAKVVEPDQPSNVYFESAIDLAPWHSHASAEYATWLRTYAVTLSGADNEAAMEHVLALYEAAMKGRPLWPYYHLGAYDAEYLLGKPASVIQSRFDRIVSLAPNERGLEGTLLELALFTWGKLRSDQKDWVISRVQTTRGAIRKRVITVVAELRHRDPSLCAQLPWVLVKRACRG